MLNRFVALVNAQEAIESRCTPTVPVTEENIEYFAINFSRAVAMEDGGYYHDEKTIRLTPAEAVDFYEKAVLPDVAEGHMSRLTFWDTQWYNDMCSNADAMLSLYDRSAERTDEDYRRNASDWLDFVIGVDAEHCMDWIEQHCGERPVLRAELFPEEAPYGVG